MSFRPPPPSAPASAVAPGRWYVESDQGWIPVDPAYDGVVEGAFRRGDAVTSVDSALTGSPFDYTVHFLGTTTGNDDGSTEAVQTNDVTGRSRTLRRFPRGEYAWQYHDTAMAFSSSMTLTIGGGDDSSSSRSSTIPWRTYPNSELLEHEYVRAQRLRPPPASYRATAPPSAPSAELVTMSASGQPVHIDMGHMIERNCATGTTRGIRRVRRDAVAAHQQATASGSAASRAGSAVLPSAPPLMAAAAASASSFGGAATAAASTAAPPPSPGGGSVDPDASVWRRPTPSSDFASGLLSDPCPICHESMNLRAELPDEIVVELRGCRGHYFHRECVRPVLKLPSGSLKCPLCSEVSGTPHTGTQPPGTMTVTRMSSSSVRGLEGVGVIVIEYNLPSGVQGPEHPHPGVRYEGTRRKAYLPDDSEGREVLRLLQVAWERRLIFTVGTSITTGRPNCVVWGGIHHKTSPNGGPYGYPDETYLARVKDELRGKGVS